MAFQSNASAFGFGAKPATTASATNLFGQTNTNQQTAPANTGTGLFGQPAGNAGTSLFGQPAQNNASTTGTGLFGQPAQQQQSAPAGGLFGQTNAAAPAAGTSLFGQPAQQQQQQQQPQQNAFGSSLFGSTTAQPSTGLFGQQQQQQQPQQQQQQPQPTAGGLFGSTAAQPSQGLFGASTNNAGGGLFGARPAAQPTLGISALGQQQPTQSQSGAPFTRSTKFNDMPDNLKKVFEDIESHIQGRVQISKELKERKVGDETAKGQELMWNTHQNLLAATATLSADAHFTRDLKAKTEQAVQDTIVATRIVDAFRAQGQGQGYLKVHASFPLEFFTRVTEQMRERLRWYKTTVEQIERKIAAAAVNQAQYTPQTISLTLQTQHATFVALANKTAGLHAELDRIRAAYTQLWRTRTGSMRDPFDERDRAEQEDVGLREAR